MLFDQGIRQHFRSRLDSLKGDEHATQRVVALIDWMLGFST
jgi:hypothetical protein